MLHQSFYNPKKSYEQNFKLGPFGAFRERKDYRSYGIPQEKFLGLPVHLPFGIPAGPLVNAKFVKAAFKKGFDICTYKTVRTREYPCHSWPNVLGLEIKGDLTLKKAAGQLVASSEYTEPLSITNSFGVPSMDPDWWQEDMKKAAKAAGPGQVMVGSFQGTPGGNGSVKAFIDDHVLAAKLVKETGTKALIINLSCPNEGSGKLLCFDVDRSTKVTEAVKNEIGNTPLMLKLAYFQDQRLLRKLVKSVGSMVQGLVTINTIPATIVDKENNQALPGEGRDKSGVCGSAIKWAGLDMVRRLKKIRDEMGLSFSIVGVGGVTAPKDYSTYLKAGADAVMSATGAMWNPFLAQQIKTSLN